MKRSTMALAFCLLGVAQLANAQGRNQFRDFGRLSRRPSFSPALNLARGGLGALAYYSQLQSQSQFGQLQGQLDDQRRILGADPRIRSTGLRARFFNYSHYYNFRNFGRFGSGGLGGGANGGGNGFNAGGNGNFAGGGGAGNFGRGNRVGIRGGNNR